MSFEYSSLKSNYVRNHLNMFGGDPVADDAKSADNLVLPDMEMLTSWGFIIGYILIAIIIIVVIYSFFNKPVLRKEGMSGGTLTQLFAQDSQNSYINSASPGIQSGNFNLKFGQPSMVASGTQRGTPLPAIRLPHTSMNPNLNESNVPVQTEASGGCTMNCPTNNKKSSNTEVLSEATCLNDPGSCGNGYGGSRLKNGFVEPTDDPRPYVGLNGTVNYPSGYLGSLWTSPTLPGDSDPMKPLKVIQPLNTQTYVKEGYE
jgi:hypothetical protein